MLLKAVQTIVFSIMILGSASLANSQGVPDAGNSWVAVEGVAPGSLAVNFILPTLTGGNPLTASRTLDGPVDATITLFLRDSENNPIVDFPGTNVLLSTPGSSCGDYGQAEGNSDSLGRLTWTRSLKFGGWSQGPLSVNVYGYFYLYADEILKFNSADINGDANIDLADVAIFTGDFFSGYSFRSDFYYDGILNLLDVAMLGQAFGDGCPR